MNSHNKIVAPNILGFSLITHIYLILFAVPVCLVKLKLGRKYEHQYVTKTKRGGKLACPISLQSAGEHFIELLDHMQGRIEKNFNDFSMSNLRHEQEPSVWLNQ